MFCFLPHPFVLIVVDSGILNFMIRNNRQLTRLFFILVLSMALFGGWYADRAWQQVEPVAVDTPTITDEFDWVDFIATLGEEALQLFLGLASPSN